MLPRQPTGSPPALLAGTFRIYRLYGIGEEIDLARAMASLNAPTARRRQSSGVRQADSIQVAQPPLRLELGAGSLSVGSLKLAGRLWATIYDLGAVAIALALSLPDPTTWTTVAELFKLSPELPPTDLRSIERAMDDLERLLRPAITRPRRSAIVEDYSILVAAGLAAHQGVAGLAEHPLVWAAMLGEQRALSPDAAGLVTAMSYYPDDLALLSWNGALLIDPDPEASATAVDLIEFAQVELLLMRDYDASGARLRWRAARNSAAHRRGDGGDRARRQRVESHRRRVLEPAVQRFIDGAPGRCVAQRR